MQTCRLTPVFWRNMLPSSSEVKKERGMPASRTDKNRKGGAVVCKILSDEFSVSVTPV